MFHFSLYICRVIKKQIMKQNNWIKSENELPRIDVEDPFHKKYKISIEVLCYVGQFKRKFFGRYNHEIMSWSIPGLRQTGGITVEYWQEILNPDEEVDSKEISYAEAAAYFANKEKEMINDTH